MRFLTEWIEDGPNVSAEERATLCDFQITIGREHLCRHRDLGSKERVDHLTIPAVHLAEGLATDWWSIFGGRDREHSIVHYRTGFAIPDLSFKFDGDVFEVLWKQLTSENPKLSFLSAGSESLSRSDVESTLSGFIERVVDRLAQAGLAHSEVTVRWSHVSNSREVPEEREFCEAAGALGIDPYLISEDDARLIEEAGKLFSEEALFEFLAGMESGGNTLRSFGEFLDGLKESEDRPKEETRLPELPGIVEGLRGSIRRRTGERAWAPGYRAARALRGAIATDPRERLPSVQAIASKLGTGEFRPGPTIPGIRALIARDEGGIRVHLCGGREEMRSQTFSFARAIGDAVCFPSTPRSVVNNLHHAERQATGRAFAAELLAPVDSVLDMIDGGLDGEEIADTFSVSPLVVDHQIENKERIEQSCQPMV